MTQKSDFATPLSSVIYSDAEKTSFRASYSCRSARYNGNERDIKYGPREERAKPPKSHLRVASSPSSAGSVGKAGITRAKRTCGASRLIVWKMAYCLHLPTTCTLWPYPTTLYMRPSSLKRSSRHLLSRATPRVQIDSRHVASSPRAR